MSRRGFTLVETLLGLGLASLLIGLVLAFLSNGTRALKIGDEHLDRHERARVALLRARARLGDAVEASISGDGTRLAFRTASGSVVIELQRAAGRLVMRASDASPEVLCTGLSGFRAALAGPGLITLSVEIAAGGGSFRMVDDVHCAALAGRPGETAFNSALDAF